MDTEVDTTDHGERAGTDARDEARDCSCCKSAGTVTVVSQGATARTWACSACGSRWLTATTP